MISNIETTCVYIYTYIHTQNPEEIFKAGAEAWPAKLPRLTEIDLKVQLGLSRQQHLKSWQLARQAARRHTRKGARTSGTCLTQGSNSQMVQGKACRTPKERTADTPTTYCGLAYLATSILAGCFFRCCIRG